MPQDTIGAPARRPRFALVGAAGYIAPRHMRAIKEVGGDLVAAMDPGDNVGILDSFFPEASFFTEFERFDRHVDKCRRRGIGADYVSICSPNYLHDAHVRFALRSSADAICEKPLVLNPWNLDGLAEIERDTGRRIHTILQLRYHDAIRSLRAKIAAAPVDRIFDVDLTYLTSRGAWYHVSWKGNAERSGGIATNIGVHFFDMLGWVFGPCRDIVVHLHGPDVAAGHLTFDRARVRWFLSINADHLPAAARAAGKRTHRSILIDGDELEFSEGFTDLHTVCYREILKGAGHGIEDARSAIEVVHRIRHARAVGLRGDAHPFCRLVTESPARIPA
jgi:UDP-N-acetyl-2-amino-2-deoxyglucuronate dehydrogenase